MQLLAYPINKKNISLLPSNGIKTNCWEAALDFYMSCNQLVAVPNADGEVDVTSESFDQQGRENHFRTRNPWNTRRHTLLEHKEGE